MAGNLNRNNFNQGGNFNQGSNFYNGARGRNGFNRTGAYLGNQGFGGNQIRIGSNQFALGSNGYRPAFSNHSFYQGYWNSHYGNGWGYPGGYGGYGYGGYGNGFGGGYGNGYGYGNGFGGGYGNGFLNSYGRGYYRPLGWGLGAWGLGGLAYNSGYLGYSNPYYVQSTGYNYAQPISVNYADSGPVSEEEGLEAAIAAFQQNEYDRALDLVNAGIEKTPNDAVMHEFRALVLFAKGDYQQAAATIHSVLAVGPGWNWTTLSGLYADVALYTPQLRALEANVRSQPKDGAARFLLAYHYMVGGSNDAAARQLTQAVELMPNDRVSADLLKMIAPPKADAAATAPQPPADATAATATIDPAVLVGDWVAVRDDGSQFSLTLTKASTFTWKHTVKDQKPQELLGKYTLGGTVLALEGSDGGSLIANITSATATGFNFKLLGSGSEDPGLNFRR